MCNKIHAFNSQFFFIYFNFYLHTDLSVKQVNQTCFVRYCFPSRGIYFFNSESYRHSIRLDSYLTLTESRIQNLESSPQKILCFRIITLQKLTQTSIAATFSHPDTFIQFKLLNFSKLLLYQGTIHKLRNQIFSHFHDLSATCNTFPTVAKSVLTEI